MGSKVSFLGFLVYTSKTFSTSLALFHVLRLGFFCVIGTKGTIVAGVCEGQRNIARGGVCVQGLVEVVENSGTRRWMIPAGIPKRAGTTIPKP